MLRSLTLLSLFVGTISIVGCSGEAAVGERATTVPLTGKLSLDGKPHGSVTLTFTPDDAEGGAKTAYAVVQADGSFETTSYVTGDGIIPGSYEVSMGKPADTGSTDPAAMMAAAQGTSISKSRVEVPAAGLTGVEIKLTSAKREAGDTGSLMLGQ